MCVGVLFSSVYLCASYMFPILCVWVLFLALVVYAPPVYVFLLSLSSVGVFLSSLVSWFASLVGGCPVFLVLVVVSLLRWCVYSLVYVFL